MSSINNLSAKMGFEAHKAGKISQAISLYTEALKQDCTEKIKVLINLGLLHKAIKKFDQAINVFEKAYEIDPDNCFLLSELSSLHLQKGDIESSLIFAKQLLRLDKENISAMTIMGICYGRNKKYHEARICFQKCINIDPKNPDSAILLSKVMANLQEYNEAISFLTSFLAGSNHYSKVYAELANLYSKLGKYELALKYISVAAKLEPRNELYIGELTRLKFLIEDCNEVSQIKSGKNANEIDNSSSFLFEDNGSKKLLIVFSSNGGPEKIKAQQPPSYNFKNLLKNEKSFDKLFIRDHNREYYLRGLGTTTKNIEETIEKIKEYTNSKNYTNIVSIGASSGGFAAILFANLLDFNKAVAFNPQTTLTSEKEKVIEDNLFTVETCIKLRNAEKNNELYQKCLNLKNFVPFNTSVEIHYSSNSKKFVDKKHAKFIEHEKCKLISHSSSTHLLALELKNNNHLLPIIIRSFDPDNNPNNALN